MFGLPRSTSGAWYFDSAGTADCAVRACTGSFRSGSSGAVTIDIRTRTVSAEQQETITRDSVTIKVNAVLWYRIEDAAKSVISVDDAPAAVYQLALTGLRNIIGQHDLDEVLQERDRSTSCCSESIVGSSARWGLEVERFEMKDVELPVAMQQVMAMQAEAIREKRARIIKAEAELEASVKLSAAAAQMAGNPVALELRRMQMVSEVGAENNSTTVLMIPSDFVSLSNSLKDYLLARTGLRGALAGLTSAAAVGVNGVLNESGHLIGLRAAFAAQAGHDSQPIRRRAVLVDFPLPA